MIFGRLTEYVIYTNKTKYLSTGANFVHVYLEIWDTGILKYNEFSM